MSDEIGLTSVKADIQVVIEGGLGVSITYRQVTAAGFAPTTGVVTETSSDTALTAVKGEIGEEDVRPGGDLQVGDAVFYVSQNSFTGPPELRDRIIHGSTTYAILRWAADAGGAAWIIYARAA